MLDDASEKFGDGFVTAHPKEEPLDRFATF